MLEALRQRLRELGFVSVIFDFEEPSSRDLTETVTLLARMARFVIADITEPGSVPLELQAIVGEVGVPVAPVLEAGHKPFSMFRTLLAKGGVLPIHRYVAVEDLLAALPGSVLPALEACRRRIANDRARARESFEEDEQC